MINREWSYWIWIKPNLDNASINLIFHCLGFYFNPYKDFISMHTRLSLCLVKTWWKLYVYLIIEINLKKDIVYIHLMYIPNKENIVLTVSMLIIWENDFYKSITSFWLKLLLQASLKPLYLSIVFELYLIYTLTPYVDFQVEEQLFISCCFLELWSPLTLHESILISSSFMIGSRFCNRRKISNVRLIIDRNTYIRHILIKVM